MGKQSKRTRAPAPLEVPPSASHLVPPAAPNLVMPPLPQLLMPPSQPVPPGAFPAQPPQSMAASSAPCWLPGLQSPGLASSSAQGPFWALPAGVGGSTYPWPMAESIDDSDLKACENLEARKLAHLAAKDHKESVMLETYRSLMMQDTTRMPEDVRSEHVLALKCLREKLFGKND